MVTRLYPVVWHSLETNRPCYMHAINICVLLAKSKLAVPFLIQDISHSCLCTMQGHSFTATETANLIVSPCTLKYPEPHQHQFHDYCLIDSITAPS